MPRIVCVRERERDTSKNIGNVRSRKCVSFLTFIFHLFFFLFLIFLKLLTGSYRFFRFSNINWENFLVLYRSYGSRNNFGGCILVGRDGYMVRIKYVANVSTSVRAKELY